MKLDYNNDEFNTVINLILNGGIHASFFLTGKAGTGKSTLIKHIVNTIQKKIVVVAPTGIVAVNVGGETIHSFFEFPLRVLLPKDEGIKIFNEDSEKRRIINDMEVLIIDEVSMVRADLIDAIDFSLRLNSSCFKSRSPFGGKQVVFVGDIFQLEPVITKNTNEFKIISEIYKGPYFFNAKVFENNELPKVELNKVYRQKDVEFTELLNKIRLSNVTQDEIDILNSRVITQDEIEKLPYTITLTTTNELASNVNKIKLTQLKTVTFEYKADVLGDFEENKYPTELILSLKVGAQVVFLKNDNNKQWVNGTIGQIFELHNDFIKVKLSDGSIHLVEKREWENVKFKFNKELGKIEKQEVGSFKQFPLKLAWAITIHKSQGLTFDNLIVDFGDGAFASGQAYVALSRVSSIKGLFLKQKISFKDIYVNKQIINFVKESYDKLNDEIDTLNLVKLGNFDRLGQKYFNKARYDIYKNNFSNAYLNILIGYEYVSYDDDRYGFSDSCIKNIHSNSKKCNCSSHEYNLVTAFIYWSSRKFSEALLYIDKYINEKPNDEIGYYIKGSIYLDSKKISNSIELFNKALQIKRTSRSLFKIGIIKEDYLKQVGIKELYEASLDNLLSTCTYYFAQYSWKVGVRLPKSDSIFVNDFKEGGELFNLGFRINELYKEHSKWPFDILNEKYKLYKVLVDNKDLFYSAFRGKVY